jgi:hypothetical protein
MFCDVPVHVTGWAWCNQRQFYRPDKVRKILFMPIHATGGMLRPEAYKANREIFSDLLNMRGDVNITIRYIGALAPQGLYHESGINWVNAEANGATDEIDNADVVIAEGTALHLAVARGVPAIGINQHLPVRTNKEPDTHAPHNWHKYGHLLAYPINYGDVPLVDLIDKAMTEQTEWRERMIGEQMNGRNFAAMVENAYSRAV